MSKLFNGDIDRSGYDVRRGLQQVGRWGAIALLAAGGLLLGLEGENALLHGGSQTQVGAGLEFVNPASGQETFISVPVADAPPRGEAGALLLLSADAMLGSVAIRRLT